MHLRIARPVTELTRATAMYCQGLGLRVLGKFENHQGFDGVMVGLPAMHYHFEFTVCRTHPVSPCPTPEDLIVFYLPARLEWQKTSALMLEAGFTEVASFNPYWEVRGRTFEDHNGYRTVLEQADWRKDQG